MGFLIHGSHHPVVSQPVFFANYDSAYLLKVTSMADGGGSAVAIPITSNAGETYASGANTVSLIEYTGFGGSYYMSQSTDGGVNFVRKQDLGAYFDSFLGFIQRYFTDATDGNLAWVGTDNTSTGVVIGWYTRDGGATWSSVNLYTVPSGYEVRNIFAFSAHDGRYGYVCSNLRTTSEPYSWLARIDKIDSTDGSATHIDVPSGSWDTDSENAFEMATVVKGTDTIFLLTVVNGSLWKIDFSDASATLIYDGVSSPIDEKQPQFKQLMTTSGGSLLWVMSQAFYEASPWLYIYRSTNGGTTWTKIDCSSLAPYTTNRSGQWDFIAESKGTLFMAFEAAGDLSITGMYSTDDGATWQKTGVLLENGDGLLTQPYDNSGVR